MIKGEQILPLPVLIPLVFADHKWSEQFDPYRLTSSNVRLEKDSFGTATELSRRSEFSKLIALLQSDAIQTT